MAEELVVGHRNLGTVNKNMVTISTDKGLVNLYFSYDTLVGVDDLVAKNVWSRTTGKFLNQLNPNKEERVEPETVLLQARLKLKRIL